MFLEGFKFNREESDSLLKEETPPYTGPVQSRFWSSWVKFGTFYFQIFCLKQKQKSEENFHIWFKFITLDKIKLGYTIIIYVIHVC